MAKRDGYASGVRAALAMISSLEMDNAVCDSADLGWDEGSVQRPQFNIVASYLESLDNDAQALEGFCSIISGFIAINMAGCCPDSTYLGQVSRHRAAADRKLARAKRDKAFAHFMADVVAPLP